MTRVVVVGAGQAGLSAAYYLPRFGIDDAVILDHNSGPGGAWRQRWPSLTLRAANRVHDLPGWGLQDALGTHCDDVPASTGVAEYFGEYEERFDIDVHRPAHVASVSRTDSGYLVAGHGIAGPFEYRTEAVINCTGTWDSPFWPTVRGASSFRGVQLHAHDYRTAEPFAGKTVAVVGAGITSVQLLLEISAVADTMWFTRREVQWDATPFDPDKGRRAVARVEERVRAGLPPGSVVSVTGLPLTPALRAGIDSGVLVRQPMFRELTPDGPLLADGSVAAADVILWCTGFRYSMDHLAPLGLRSPGGGIVMTGRLATEVAGEPRLHLLGYGPSASTIGANRAGREAARAVAEAIGASGPGSGSGSGRVGATQLA
ncbi:NAD(P)-binding domain-containing protein [Tsukamurella pseudospumae]|uniref:Pyridine nucleotide-disulfide oxidoreductase n=1 Tax=Tsukamurella pseudospumae TaxID=239498 RepID=A0A137ZZR0_9ACTN|nr:NAD(P)-binding domain-containing protein [Tsukamurella pseudospumae]KXP03665.1 pyridine nucleotide-disulfide oxidoreductase [Tsukamurella pseudospumae]